MGNRVTYNKLKNRVKHLEALLAQVQGSKTATSRETRFRSLVENMTDGLSEINPEGIATYANDRLCEMWGYSREEIIGRSVFSFLDAANRKVLSRQLAERRKGRSDPYELVWTRKDGSRIHTHMAPKPYYSDRGDFLGSFAVITDITERKIEQEMLCQARDELERRVRQRTEELEAKNRSLEELNTALRVLLEKRDEDRTEIENRMQSNIKERVLPYLEKMYRCNLNHRQQAWVDIIRSALEEITSPFALNLNTGYQRLTPMEIQVADLIKSGRTTKEIAAMLNLSPQTIACHRKHIRKKIGIRNKKANLRTTLAATK